MSTTAKATWLDENGVQQFDWAVINQIAVDLGVEPEVFEEWAYALECTDASPIIDADTVRRAFEAEFEANSPYTR